MSVLHIPLSRGQSAIVDEADAALVGAFRWQANPVQKREEGYYATCGRVIAKRRVTIYMHRLILAPAAHELVDHVNGEGLDNRRCNLRIATRSQNLINRPVVNPHGFRGVERMVEGNWRAKVTVARRQIYSGRFVTSEDAARAYDAMATVHHGEFAMLNFPACRRAA